MSYRSLQGIKIKGYKCFLSKNDYQGFDEIKPINILIGKNNSGKSKILEFIRTFIQENSSNPLIDTNRSDDFLINKILQESDLRPIFHEGHSGGWFSYIRSGDHWHGIGKRLLGKRFIYSRTNSEIIDHDINLKFNNAVTAYRQIIEELNSRLHNSFHGYIPLTIHAERDIKKEGVSFNSNTESDFIISPDGQKLTQLIVQCLSAEQGHTKQWQSLVEKHLLSKINDVFYPDLNFSRIHAKVDKGNGWEIYLEEEKKGSIKLSDCGSGLKTVIIVMVTLYIVTHFQKGKKFAFFFEELENNLHPSLERKLLTHIRDYIKENTDHVLFLTTHSNIAIDMFGKDEDAQILRAYNDGEASFIGKIQNWNDRNNLLDDLGVKASDVLQSNCLIWLEGPSDRIYFNKWIELFNDGAPLEEGLHYQCVFYGGAVLSHYMASTASDNEFIQMLRINRNAIILMDSDKAKQHDGLKPRVERVIQEATSSNNMIAWVTAGREIENYIPDSILSGYFKADTSLKQFGIIAKRYQTIKDVKGFDKVKFASDITSLPAYTKGALQDHLDLAEKMSTVINLIRKCNN